MEWHLVTNNRHLNFSNVATTKIALLHHPQISLFQRKFLNLICHWMNFFTCETAQIDIGAKKWTTCILWSVSCFQNKTWKLVSSLPIVSHCWETQSSICLSWVLVCLWQKTAVVLILIEYGGNFQLLVAANGTKQSPQTKPFTAGMSGWKTNAWQGLKTNSILVENSLHVLLAEA